MPADHVVLGDAHRRAIGARLEGMSSLIRELRADGINSEVLEEIEQSIRGLEVEAEAIAPAPPRGRIQSALAQLLVLAYEIGPLQLKAYGALDTDATAFLATRSDHLRALVEQLIDG
jgi:hypothetical protein